MKLNDIIKVIETTYPLSLQEEWDCSGLLIRKDEINTILVCLDITPKIAKIAIANKIDLIISHHPLIFNNYFKTPSYLRKVFQKLYANNIAVYAAHTSFDNSDEGMNVNFVKELGYLPNKGAEMFVDFKCDNNLINNLKKLDVPIRIYNPKDSYHQAVVLLGGGGSFIEQINDVDVYLSSEFKHNEILMAMDKNLTLIDISHQAEIIFNKVMKEYLTSHLALSISSVNDKYRIEQF